MEKLDKNDYLPTNVIRPLLKRFPPRIQSLIIKQIKRIKQIKSEAEKLKNNGFIADFQYRSILEPFISKNWIDYKYRYAEKMFILDIEHNEYKFHNRYDF